MCDTHINKFESDFIDGKRSAKYTTNRLLLIVQLCSGAPSTHLG